MTNTYTSDVQVLIQFAKDQGWDLPDVMEAVARLEAAITEGLQAVFLSGMNAAREAMR